MNKSSFRNLVKPTRHQTKDSNQIKLNKQIYRYLKQFVEDKDVLAAALVQNPFGKTTGLAKIKKLAGANVAENIKLLNQLHRLNPSILRNVNKSRALILMYLANFNFTLDKPGIKKHYSTKKIAYALKLLEKIDITELKMNLEDKFFSLLYPNVYKSYISLLSFTRKKYNFLQKEICAEFNSLLNKNHIKADIETRLKTIYSIHNKITRKNILLSQILDTIGIRIIVDTEDECYKTMVLLLKNNSVMASRVKDYIAIPKENGYQSIHLTILYDNHPLEIQIRTWEMHQKAQYGIASHNQYKK